MQTFFEFAAPSDDVPLMRDPLRAAFRGYRPHNIREPVGQLLKSMISSRTKDAVSLRSYESLVGSYPSWLDLAEASTGNIERTIRDVTFAPEKAAHIKEALRLVALISPDFDLSWLKQRPVPQALEWLETLPGVGRKVAASTLNFSTLAMPAFVVDTHVIRVLARLWYRRRPGRYHNRLRRRDGSRAALERSRTLGIPRSGEAVGPDPLSLRTCRLPPLCAARNLSLQKPPRQPGSI